MSESGDTPTLTSLLLARRAPMHADVTADGRIALTTTHVPVDSDEVVVMLTVMDASTGEESPIAGALADDHTGVWDPAGLGLVWHSLVDGESVLRWSSAADAPASMVPHSERVMGGPAWSPDGRFLAWTAPRAQAIDRTRPFRYHRGLLHFDGVGELDTPPQLRVLDVETSEARWLTDDDRRWSTLRWSPDSSTLAACAGLDPHGRRGGQQLVLVGLDNSVRIPDIPSGRVVLPVWKADGRLLVLVVDPHDQPIGSEAALFVVDGTPGGAAVERIAVTGIGGDVYGDQPAELVDVYDNVLLVAADGSLITRVVDCGRMGIVRWRLDAPSERTVLVGGEFVATPVGLFGDQLVLVSTSPNATAELSVVGLDGGGGAQPLTRFGDGSSVATRRFSVATDAPAPIDAWLLTPPGVDRPLPAVLIVHGGPNFAYGETFSIDAHALVDAGFAVLYSNPRGSTGAGEALTRAGLGDWAEGPSRDVLAVIDHAAAEGWIDPERLGVTGNSYGGYLAAWLAATTSRFRAAVAENPVTELVGMAATSDIGSWFFPSQFGASPADAIERYVAQSPLYRAAECTTPILWVSGELDRRCPPAQAWAMHKALRQRDAVSEMLVLPNSSHEGSTYGPPAARRAHDAALVDWMCRYVVD